MGRRSWMSEIEGGRAWRDKRSSRLGFHETQVLVRLGKTCSEEARRCQQVSAGPASGRRPSGGWRHSGGRTRCPMGWRAPVRSRGAGCGGRIAAPDDLGWRGRTPCRNPDCLYSLPGSRVATPLSRYSSRWSGRRGALPNVVRLQQRVGQDDQSAGHGHECRFSFQVEC